jgi:glycosyltransferase involved in cell wall biosynthesis
LLTSKPILLVTETPPGTPNGFGVTLDCLFKNIDHRVLYTDVSFKIHGDNNGYILGQVPFHSSRRYFLKFLFGLIPEWRGRYSHKWLKTNLGKEYSAVYAFVYSVECIKFSNWISGVLGIPLLIHLADHSKDFQSIELTKTLQECSKVICITGEMQKNYETMLGRKDIEVLHNGAEARCFNIQEPKNSPFSKDNPFRFCFLGGLFSHLHGDCIEDFFVAIEEVRKKYQWVEFNLFGQKQPASFLNEFLSLDGVKHHGIIMPLDKKFEIMEQAHCFLIPSSFNPNRHEDYKYSFPTKLPELIACGRPILSYGPADTSANRLLGQHNIGIRIHKRSVDVLVRNMLELIEKYSQNLDFAKNSRKLAESYLSADQVRLRLSQIIGI